MEINAASERVDNTGPALEPGDGLERLEHEAGADHQDPPAVDGEQPGAEGQPVLPPVDEVAAANVHEVLTAVLGVFAPAILAGVAANDRVAAQAGLTVKPGLMRVAEAWARVPFIQRWFGAAGGSPVLAATMETGIVLGAGYVTVAKAAAAQRASDSDKPAPDATKN